MGVFGRFRELLDLEEASALKSTLVPFAQSIRESLHRRPSFTVTQLTTAVERSRHRCQPRPQSVTGNFILKPSSVLPRPKPELHRRTITTPTPTPPPKTTAWKSFFRRRWS
ncbi:uncharacterized protein G2W53_001842 [Senna tora]|uniref:Uncharacterized protein n=1 Tax=Senna tora TaxID=362788 RepID=A0A835CMX3_9FABA|nr:uncharacterized protein G2W53_001842 [Senna tora]